ncbi:MAG: cytochrome c3 family protein [Anaerolineales bacterium]
MRNRSILRVAFILTISLILFSTLGVGGAAADGGEFTPHLQDIDNDSCLFCHEVPGKQMDLASGEVLYLTINGVSYITSAHGREGIACVDCHANITGFPHDPISASSIREFTLDRYTLCADCHQDKYDATLDSVHQKSLAGGNLEAAVCTDCHNPHNTQSPHVPRSRIPQTCERCHSQIYELYEESVHGSALIGEGNPDVPTCTDCHGVHSFEGPSDEAFHLFSPQICADCHTDETLMARYDVSTDVFESYVADFHGTTVILFEETAPDQETNKPVCIDCHGVHNMRSVDDPESQVIKENLLSTCQKCHPDADENFPSSWLSHYQPSRENAPLVYYVNLFYKILIPVVIGGMLIFVISDGIRKMINKRRGGQNE